MTLTPPPQIARHPHWTLWRSENGQKVPCDRRGKRTWPQAIDDPSPTLQWDQARSARGNGSAVCTDGLAMVLRDHSLTRLVAVDVDDVSLWDPDELDEFLAPFYEVSYVEESPSGDGLHVLCYGDVPEDHRCSSRDFHGGRVQVYSRNRFMTFTGQEVSCGDLDRDATEVLARQFAPLWSGPGATRVRPSDIPEVPEALSDEDVLFEMAGMAADGEHPGAEAFVRIHADGPAAESDPSDAVTSAVSSLVHVTKSLAQIRRILSESPGFSSWTDRSGHSKLGRWLDSQLPRILARRLEEDRLAHDQRDRAVEELGYADRYAWVTGEGKFYDVVGQTFVTKESLGAAYAPYHTGTRGDPLLPTLLLSSPETRRVDRITWMPRPSWGVPRVDVVRRGYSDQLNTWQGYSLTPTPGPVDPWLRLLAHLVPDEEERGHVLRRIAFDVQHPERKCNWHLVLIGTHGAGKDSLLAPVAEIFGSAASSVGDKEIKSQYDDELAQKKVVVVNEVRGLSGSSLERVKKLSASENNSEVSLNIKSQGKITHPNLWSFYFFTNHDDAIQADESERRFFVCRSDEVMPESLRQEYYESWLPAGGASHLLRYLLDVDLSDFSPNTIPSRTRAFMDMVEDAELDVHSAMRDAFTRGEHGVRHGLVDPKQVGQIFRHRGYHKCRDQDARDVLKRLGWQKLHTRPQATVDGENVKKPAGLWAPKDSPLHAMRPTELFHAVERIEALVEGGDFLE